MIQRVKELALKTTVYLFHDQKGQGVLEYFLVIAGMGLVAAFFVSNLANDGIGPKFSELTGKIQSIKLPDLGLTR